MVGEGGDLEACVPEPGSFALDVRDGRVGRVMGRVGPYVQLRPPGGARSGTARPMPSGRPRRGWCCGRG